jgi:predicted outer membrane protein
LAESIIAANNRINNELTGIAAEYKLQLPTDITEEQKTEWKKLVKEKGWAFDKMFAVKMDDNLKAEYQLYTHFSTSATDGMMKKIAVAGLMELQKQGDLAIAQQEKIQSRTGENTTEEKTEVVANLKP